MKYPEEAEIRSLALYYEESGFSDIYAEELYAKLVKLSGLLARKYYRMADGDDLEELSHNAATEVLLRLKDGRAKSDMEAWTQYVKMRVRTCVTSYLDRQRFGYESWTKNDVDLTLIEEPGTDNQVVESEYKAMMHSIIKSYVDTGKQYIFFKDEAVGNIFLYLGLLNWEDSKDMINFKMGSLTNFLSCLFGDLLQKNFDYDRIN